MEECDRTMRRENSGPDRRSMCSGVRVLPSCRIFDTWLVIDSCQGCIIVREIDIINLGFSSTKTRMSFFTCKLG